MKIFKDIVTKEDYQTIKKRDYHLKWCENCSNSEKDINKGLICKLTKDIASFDNICKDYTVEKDVVEKNIKLHFEKNKNVNYIKNIFEFELKETNKPNLNNEIKIKRKKIPNSVYYIILMDFLYIMMLYFFDFMNVFAILIMLTSSILPISFILAGASDQSVKLVINKDFIEICNSKIEYKNLIVFYIKQIEKEDNSNTQYLVFRDKNNIMDFFLRLTGLNINYKQIINSILQYKKYSKK